jgi:hypothetical protein
MMPDKEAKKKALDLMIVVGNSKPKEDMNEDKGDMKCECPCCGRECSYCEKENSMEDDMEDSMEEDNSDMEEDD